MRRAIASVTRTLPQEQLLAYAEASGDHNPIHVDPEFARGTPFGGTIAHGMLVLALIGDMMFAAHGDEWASRGKLKVRFKAPARPGDSVTASAERVERDGVPDVEYTVRCANQRGEILVEGRASIAAVA